MHGRGGRWTVISNLEKYFPFLKIRQMFEGEGQGNGWTKKPFFFVNISQSLFAYCLGGLCIPLRLQAFSKSISVVFEP